MDYKLDQFEKFNDVRGDLVVFLRASNLLPEQKKFGQIYFVTFNEKGTIRANHYHKQIREWFGVVDGEVQVFLKNVHSGETKEFILSAQSATYSRLEIGPNVAHAFRSLTPHASIINYTDKEWFQEDVFSMQILT
jgi:dTDP-4-dehydrorhamnose 3,5-epimerase